MKEKIKNIIWNLESIFMKKKIMRIAAVTGRDFDGDLVYYNRKRYFVDTFNNKIQRVS